MATGEKVTMRTALAAAVRNQLKSLNSQTRRLHKSSARVFGAEVPFDVCREVIAVANGYRNWQEVEALRIELREREEAYAVADSLDAAAAAVVAKASTAGIEQM